MNLQTINEILKYAEYPESCSILTLYKQIEDEYYGEESSGTEKEKCSLYKIQDEEAILVKVTLCVDSYGDNERVKNVQFVKALSEEVLNFN